MLKALFGQQTNPAELALSFLLRSRPRAPWTLVTEGGKLPVVASFQPHIAAEQAAARAWIAGAQRHGRGIQHLVGETETPLHRPMTEEEIVASAAIAIEITGTPDEQRARAGTLPQPTALIATGRAVVAIFALRDRLPMATVQQIGKPLAVRAQGHLVWLVPLPGTVRNTGHRVAIIQHNPQRIVEPAELMPPAPGKRRRVVRADSIAPAHVDWLWRHMIPKGELTLIAGFGSAGKTTMCLGLCATITREGAWPDGTPAPAGRALVIEGEDPVDSVTVPRLLAAGADLSRVTIVDQGEDMLTAADLEEAATGLDDLRLVVLSPIRRLIHDNQGSNTEIRRRLEPLIAWARHRRVGLIGVMHPQKGNKSQSADAFAGSPAYTELGRMAHLATIDETDPQPADLLKRRKLVSVKTNIAPVGISHSYRIETAWAGEIETSRVVWLTPGADIPAAGGRAEPAAPPPPIYRTAAQAWLAAKLAEGPMQAALLEKWAGESGISRASLYRAATALNVIRSATPGAGKSWQLRNGDGRR